MTQGHGDDSYRYTGVEILHNFSTNVYSGFDHSGLLSHLASTVGSIRNYPEPEPLTLECELSRHLAVSPDSLTATAGATAAIYLIAQSRRGSRSAVIQPTFSEYSDACSLHGHQVHHVGSLEETPTEADIIWLCNPNNPTGLVTDHRELIGYIDRHPDKLFVVDQAYADYTCRRVLSAQEAVTRPNLILLGSLTKRFGVPGLRLGYMVASPTLTREFKVRRQPWAIGALSIEGARYLLSHSSDFVIDADCLCHEARRMASELRQLGIATSPTDCNILLCHLPCGDAAALKDYLALNHATLIRDASNFPGLDNRHFRIAPLTPGENDLLVKNISQWIQSHNTL